MKTVHYPAIIQKNNNNYFVHFLDFPAIQVSGNGLIDALNNARHALYLHENQMVDENRYQNSIYNPKQEEDIKIVINGVYK